MEGILPVKYRPSETMAFSYRYLRAKMLLHMLNIKCIYVYVYNIEFEDPNNQVNQSEKYMKEKYRN